MSAEPAELSPPLQALLKLLGSDPTAPVSASTRPRAREVHIADSLSGLGFEQLRDAGRVADLGSGAGLPGLVLAAELPGARVDLIESVSRKAEFLRRAIARMELDNAEVVAERAEAHSAAAGREAYDVVSARAVGSLATLAELASPLLRSGGFLLAWKGRRDPEQEARSGPRVVAARHGAGRDPRRDPLPGQPRPTHPPPPQEWADPGRATPPRWFGGEASVRIRMITSDRTRTG